MRVTRINQLISAAMALCLPSAVNATIARLGINDASQVMFEADISGGVYFRNFNQFDPTWLGCCTAYWIDVSTDAGRAQYAVFLSAYISGQKIAFYGDTTGGTFSHVGWF